MTLTFATFLFLPLALWAAFRTSRTVTVLAGTVGFSSTAVFNFPAIPFGFQPYHLFGMLLIVRALLDARVRKTERQRRRVTWILYALGMFWLAAAVSVVVATPRVDVTRFYMVSQLVHLGFGIGVCWAVSRVVRTPGTLRAACTGFQVGAVFIAAWGILQFTLDRVGGAYPDYVFNNSVGLNANLGGSEIIAAGVIRAGSVATEPSYLVRTLVMALALMTVRHARGTIPQRRWLLAGVAIIVLGIIFAASSTGYFGFALLVLAGGLAGRRWRVQRYAAGAMVLAAFVPLLSPSVMKAVLEMTANKSRTGSYDSRRDTVEFGWSIFKLRPVFGVGFGNLTVHDLAVKVLSNVGVVGASTLLVVWLGLLMGRVLPEHAGALRPELRALKLAVAVLVAMDWVSGYSYPYGDGWLLVGLLLAAMTLGPSSAAEPSRTHQRIVTTDHEPALGPHPSATVAVHLAAPPTI